MRRSTQGFTLIETSIALGIVAVIVIFATAVLEPAELFRQARDHNRISSLASMDKVLQYAQQTGNFPDEDRKIHISIPDYDAACQSIPLPPLTGGWTYECKQPNSYQQSDGGWIPASIPGLSESFNQLPIDPVNGTKDSHLYYYALLSNHRKYQLMARFESDRTIVQSSSKDGGVDAFRYEVGSNLGLWGVAKGATQANGNLTVIPGLVGYWPFDGNTNDMVDKSNGTLYGQATFASGKLDQGLSLDNDFDYVTVPHSADFEITGDLTLSAWIYKTSNSGADVIIGKGCFNSACPYSLRTTKTVGLVVLDQADSGGMSSVASISGVSLNTWVHVAVTRTGTIATVFINGVQDSSGTFTRAATANGAPITIGTVSAQSPTNFFGGIIDDLRVYNRVLSAAEVQSIYTAGTQGHP